LVSNSTFSYKCLSAGLQEKSSARVNISESIPGNPERILSVQGPLDAVSKVRVWHKSSSISYTDTPSAYPPPSSRHLVSSSDESTMNRLINPLSLVLEPSRSSSSSPTLGWVACALLSPDNRREGAAGRCILTRVLPATGLGKVVARSRRFRKPVVHVSTPASRCCQVPPR
jgi:hypothetical protein